MTDAISPLDATMSQAFLGGKTGMSSSIPKTGMSSSIPKTDRHPMTGTGNSGKGGVGGTPFTLRNKAHNVSKIKVWTDTGSYYWRDRQLIKDIEVTWDDGDTDDITGNQSGTSFDFDFKDNMKITKMTLRTGDRVDRITFITDKKRHGDYMKFDAGDMEKKENGSPHEQLLGNGILCGFHGKYDDSAKELISLGADFKD